ncbi:RelA/SpoT domain-containing protein [Brevibacterium sp. BDJS002]|uniref:RelA/SpoT domain-containing protein n=1 Tax=Brevibacterium sp. BDJS002 TaxID=3020906 RepID=UPI002306FCF7|nr:RelA/SpoT domain-containing protein [Brevibacterium sp. BDJS002]WCE41081.1 RelA/SpoT domain-containing protein [Brevibacterium sp. BDJS002]
MAAAREISKSRAKKIGKVLRHAPGTMEEVEDYMAAIDDLDAYRASFQSPLVRINNGIRHYARQAGVEARVTQRLKRLPTIVDKLSRVAGLDLSRMQDIGGCRAVTEDIHELQKLRTVLERAWGADMPRQTDYVAEPRESGYRAIHLVVKRDDKPIEIQLRSAQMHSWAEFIEGLSGALGENYKQDGSSVVQDLGKSLSVRYRCEEESLPEPEGLDATINQQLADVNAALKAHRTRRDN